MNRKGNRGEKKHDISRDGVYLHPKDGVYLHPKDRVSRHPKDRVYHHRPNRGGLWFFLLLATAAITIGVTEKQQWLGDNIITRLGKIQATVGGKPVESSIGGEENTPVNTVNVVDVIKPVNTTNPINPLNTANARRLSQQDFSHIDTIAKSIIYEGDSVDELSGILSQYAKTPAEKARIIYTWIAHNIKYDVSALSALKDGQLPDVTVENVLRQRATICSGYANLYQELAEKMGLKSVIVEGYARGADFGILPSASQVNHGWNAVEIDGNWYLIDVTWGAGNVKNGVFYPEFEPFYFAPPPSQLIYTHFPQDSQWQLLDNPISRNEFDSLPRVYPPFFKHNIQLVSHPYDKIKAGNSVAVVLKTPENVDVIATVKSEENPVEGNYILVQKEGENTVVNVSFPGEGQYRLDIFAKEKDEGNNYYPLAVTYQVSASGKGEEFPEVYKHFREYNGYLESPLTGKLNKNQNYYFRLKIDKATEVKVLNQATNQWHDLTAYGNIFAGNVNVGDGHVVVYAKFPHDSRYWGLLKYSP